MIQGGGNANGEDDPGYTIEAEILPQYFHKNEDKKKFENEAEAWEKIKDSTEISAFVDFRKNYPKTSQAKLAKNAAVYELFKKKYPQVNIKKAINNYFKWSCIFLTCYIVALILLRNHSNGIFDFSYETYLTFGIIIFSFLILLTSMLKRNNSKLIKYKLLKKVVLWYVLLLYLLLILFINIIDWIDTINEVIDYGLDSFMVFPVIFFMINLFFFYQFIFYRNIFRIPFLYKKYIKNA